MSYCFNVLYFNVLESNSYFYSIFILCVCVCFCVCVFTYFALGLHVNTTLKNFRFSHAKKANSIGMTHRSHSCRFQTKHIFIGQCNKFVWPNCCMNREICLSMWNSRSCEFLLKWPDFFPAKIQKQFYEAQHTSCFLLGKEENLCDHLKFLQKFPWGNLSSSRKIPDWMDSFWNEWIPLAKFCREMVNVTTP